MEEEVEEPLPLFADKGHGEGRKVDGEQVSGGRPHTVDPLLGPGSQPLGQILPGLLGPVGLRSSELLEGRAHPRLDDSPERRDQLAARRACRDIRQSGLRSPGRCRSERRQPGAEPRR